MLHWLLHYLGMDSASGPAYLAWSGWGSDIAEVALLGAVFGAWHRVNCHVKGCFRIGRQHVAGTTFVTCRRHHPDDKPTAAHVAAAHEAAKAAPYNPFAPAMERLKRKDQP